jgi:hypothetical protein
VAQPNSGGAPIRLIVTFEVALAFRAHALAKAQRTVEARAALGELERRAQQQYVPPSTFATIYAGLDEPQTALDWLERCDFMD